jgi:cytochrome oxidase Cu insertion factor (SCO1/SenC/PrrC family)
MVRKTDAAPWRLWAAIVAGVLVVTAAATVPLLVAHGSAPTPTLSASQRAGLLNPDVDTGTPIPGAPAAPDFHLLDQFGQPVSLSEFHGKVVLLGFADSHCTSICPLTSESMVEAVRLLGAAGRAVQLLCIDANPDATRVADVRDYSVAHGLMRSWLFLTGPRPALEQVWRSYHVYVAAVHGNIDHQPAVYLIDQSGRERTLYVTQMAYGGVAQQAQLLADGIGRLLHVQVRQRTRLTFVHPVTPAKSVTLTAVGGADRGQPVVLGPGHPHLVFFFDTWLSEQGGLPARLTALNTYVAQAKRSGWPALVAVDVATTEPDSGALPRLLAGLRLDYPVVVDETGQIADGYRVVDEPWFDLVSAAGALRFTNDGWFPLARLTAAVRRAVG